MSYKTKALKKKVNGCIHFKNIFLNYQDNTHTNQTNDMILPMSNNLAKFLKTSMYSAVCKDCVRNWFSGGSSFAGTDLLLLLLPPPPPPPPPLLVGGGGGGGGNGGGTDGCAGGGGGRGGGRGARDLVKWNQVAVAFFFALINWPDTVGALGPFAFVR